MSHPHWIGLLHGGPSFLKWENIPSFCNICIIFKFVYWFEHIGSVDINDTKRGEINNVKLGIYTFNLYVVFLSSSTIDLHGVGLIWPVEPEENKTKSTK